MRLSAIAVILVVLYSSAALHAQLFEPGERILALPEGARGSARAEDLDGDGRAEIVLRIDEPPAIWVFPGGLSEASIEPVITPLAEALDGIRFADLDRDGEIDIIASTPSPIRLLVVRGLGGFRFASSIPIRDVEGIRSFAIETTASRIRVLSGEEDGARILAWIDGEAREVGFLPLAAHPSRIHFIHSRDFNGDGHPDILAARTEDDAIVMALGREGGGYAPFSPVWRPGTESCEVGDFDGDGRWDLVIRPDPARDTIEVVFGRGDGSFEEDRILVLPLWVTPSAAGDIDGDGRDEIFGTWADASNLIWMVSCAPDRVLSLRGTWVTLAGWASAGAICDVTGDGIPDLVASSISASGGVSILPGDGAGGLRGLEGRPVPNNAPGALAIGDIDGDRIADFAFLPAHGARLILSASSNPALAGGLRWLLLETTQGMIPALQVFDTDADGMDEVVLVDDGWLRVFRRHASGIGYTSRFGPAAEARDLVPLDMDRDGITDLAALAVAGGSVSLYRGTGDGGFAPAGMFDISGSASDLLSSDFNGDGRKDLVTVREDALDLFQGDGAGGFAGPVTYALPQPSVAVVAGDFDGDGISDLANVGTWTIQLFHGSRAGLLLDPLVHRTPLVATRAVSGDFDGDGRSDLAISQTEGWDYAGLDAYDIFTYLGDAEAGLIYVGRERANAAHAIEAADIDGDGRSDIALILRCSISIHRSRPHPARPFIRSEANGDDTVNLADPVHTLMYLFTNGGRSRCDAAADADGNGRLDLADAIHTLSYLFAGGEAPPSPFPSCGRAPEGTASLCIASPCEDVGR